MAGPPCVRARCAYSKGFLAAAFTFSTRPSSASWTVRVGEGLREAELNFRTGDAGPVEPVARVNGPLADGPGHRGRDRAGHGWLQLLDEYALDGLREAAALQR